ncbi:hypothetical protein AYI87_05215 [Shewanella sp. KCT]|nr:hypothetical protein AYI87_05215 [Shewanella sp. KCT]
MASNTKAGFIKITCVEFFGQCKRSYKNKKHMPRFSMLARGKGKRASSLLSCADEQELNVQLCAISLNKLIFNVQLTFIFDRI